MTGTPVYLDYQATTPIDPKVRLARRAPSAESHEDPLLFSRRTTGIGDVAYGVVS